MGDMPNLRAMIKKCAKKICDSWKVEKRAEDGDVLHCLVQTLQNLINEYESTTGESVRTARAGAEWEALQKLAFDIERELRGEQEETVPTHKVGRGMPSLCEMALKGIAVEQG